MKYYLYKITNIVNGKVYIGQSVEPNRRWSKHKTATRGLIKGNNKNPQFIHKAMAKHGIDNFTFNIICTCAGAEEAGLKEDELIEQYNSRDEKCGYNLIPGGKIKAGKDHPWFGRNHSDKSKSLISNKMQNNKNWINSSRMSGKKHSEKTKKKLAQKLTGNSNAFKPDKIKTLCRSCNKEIRNATYCKDCVPRTKIDWPPDDELIKMVQESSLTAVGRKFGVSDNAVRKRLKRNSRRKPFCQQGSIPSDDSIDNHPRVVTLPLW